MPSCIHLKRITMYKEILGCKNCVFINIYVYIGIDIDIDMKYLECLVCLN